MGEEDVHDMYLGEVNESNFPEGLETLTYLIGDRNFWEFVIGKKNGLGTYIWPNHEDQEIYLGEFTNDNFGKTGKIFYNNGHKYEGEVFDGGDELLQYGNGVKKLLDGKRYEWTWRRRKNDNITS